jgi:hypothetical protein
VQDDFGGRISARALSVIGVKFCLHGRSVESGLDCVGLLADALGAAGFSAPIPASYSLRGRFDSEALAFFDRYDFQTFGAGELPAGGDFALVCPAPRQLHFIIYASNGFVHAHAGLRRVTLTPGGVPWPVIRHWRYIGD